MPALTFSDVALLGREANYCNTGGTRAKCMSSPVRLLREQMP
jgi:hypothetical protein